MNKLMHLKVYGGSGWVFGLEEDAEQLFRERYGESATVWQTTVLDPQRVNKIELEDYGAVVLIGLHLASGDVFYMTALDEAHAIEHLNEAGFQHLLGAGRWDWTIPEWRWNSDFMDPHMGVAEQLVESMSQLVNTFE